MALPPLMNLPMQDLGGVVGRHLRTGLLCTPPHCWNRRNRERAVYTLTLQVPPATNLANKEVGRRGGVENIKADRILKLETVLQRHNKNDPDHKDQDERLKNHSGKQSLENKSTCC